MRGFIKAKGESYSMKEPASLVGAYLFNALLEREVRRDAYYAQAQMRIPSDKSDEWTLISLVVQGLAEGYFTKGVDGATLLAFADYVIAHMPPQLDLERNAVAESARAVLASSTEPPMGISLKTYIKIETVIAILIVRRRRFTELDVLKIIRSAEDEASKTGIALTPV